MAQYLPHKIDPSKPPSDEFKVASLTTIDYGKLLRNDPQEAKSLFDASVNRGFFYLDLTGENTEQYLQNVKSLFDFNKSYFDQPMEDKLKDMHKVIDVYNICGFKPMGRAGLDEGNAKQKANGSENIRVPADLVLCPKSAPLLSWPSGVLENQQSFSSHITESRALAIKILESLGDSLGLEGEARFETRHKPEFPSTSASVLQHYPISESNLPDNTGVGHFTHTDTGSITVLFNSDWGLQVHLPDTEEWEWVPPREGCAIVNIGDSLKFLSDFKLRSSLHRVVPWDSVNGDRYASIFFLRANNDAEFVDTEGNKWKARDWLNRKFLNYRQPHETQKKNAISTGKLNFNGLIGDPSKVTVIEVSV